MKIIPTTYIFDASAKTIDCQDFVDIERIQLITNVKTGDIVYQFNNSNKLGTLTGSILSLTYDTTAMNDNDDIMIVMDDGNVPATEAKQDELIAVSELSILLREIYSTLQMPRNADTTNNADRVTVVNTVATTVSSIATLTNLTQFNGQQAHQMSVASEINAWTNTQRITIS